MLNYELADYTTKVKIKFRVWNNKVWGQRMHILVSREYGAL